LDKGVWITWYDLPAEGREDYLAWVGSTYIPEMLKRPGYVWGAHFAVVDKGARATNARDTRNTVDDPAVPKGDRYLLLFGATDADVFGNPAPSALHAALPSESRKMLALRQGERTNIFAEAGRVEGPESAHCPAGSGLPPCIQVGAYNTPWQAEEDMLAFYAQWRMPAMGRTPGCVRIRKLASVAGWAKHGVLYEFASLEARNVHFMRHEDGRPDMKEWGDRVTKQLVHAPGSSSLAQRIWPPVTA
jgi:hypothetical protein